MPASETPHNRNDCSPEFWRSVAVFAF
jgi:hypothetical protein